MWSRRLTGLAKGQPGDGIAGLEEDHSANANCNQRQLQARRIVQSRFEAGSQAYKAQSESTSSLLVETFTGADWSICIQSFSICRLYHINLSHFLPPKYSDVSISSNLSLVSMSINMNVIKRRIVQ